MAAAPTEAGGTQPEAQQPPTPPAAAVGTALAPQGGSGSALTGQPAPAKPVVDKVPTAVPFGAFMSVEFMRKYSVDVTATAKVTATLKSVPPPKGFTELIEAWAKTRAGR